MHGFAFRRRAACIPAYILLVYLHVCRRDNQASPESNAFYIRQLSLSSCVLIFSLAENHNRSLADTQLHMCMRALPGQHTPPLNSIPTNICNMRRLSHWLTNRQPSCAKSIGPPVEFMDDTDNNFGVRGFRTADAGERRQTRRARIIAGQTRLAGSLSLKRQVCLRAKPSYK